MNHPGPYQQQGYPPSQGQYATPYYPAPMWRCPYCGTTQLPRIYKKVSTAGWIVFVVLLVACFVLCWIGLLMKDDHRMCSVCGSKVG